MERSAVLRFHVRDDVARELVEEHEAAAVRVHRVEGLAELLGVVVEVLGDRRHELVLRHALVALCNVLKDGEELVVKVDVVDVAVRRSERTREAAVRATADARECARCSPLELAGVDEAILVTLRVRLATANVPRDLRPRANERLGLDLARALVDQRLRKRDAGSCHTPICFGARANCLAP